MLICNHWIQRRIPIKGRSSFGIVIGLLWFLPFNVLIIDVAGKLSTLVVVNGLWFMVEQSAGGVVIGYVCRLKSS